MSWFSILPAHLTVIETWIIRFFLLLTILTIGPWALFLAYDLLLYSLRTIHYEIPYYGGRAQGKRRPQKPTLEQRPDGGKRRVLSMSIGSGGSGSEGSPTAAAKGRIREWEGYQGGDGGGGGDRGIDAKDARDDVRKRRELDRNRVSRGDNGRVEDEAVAD